MKNILAIILALTIVLFTSVPVLAIGNNSVSSIKANGSSSKQKTVNKVNNSSEAARIVKRKIGGKVLKVKNNGRSGFKVKVIKPNGHIISVTVDAKTGKVKRK